MIKCQQCEHDYQVGKNHPPCLNCVHHPKIKDQFKQKQIIGYITNYSIHSGRSTMDITLRVESTFNLPERLGVKFKIIPIEK